jgi:hypothetical protein
LVSIEASQFDHSLWVSDNKLALNAARDLAMLRVQLEELEQAGYNAAITGFGATEISDLLTPEELPPSDLDPDAARLPSACPAPPRPSSRP